MIKKIALSLFSIGILSTTIQANDETKGFIGLEMGYTQTQTIYNEDDKDLSYGIKIGAMDNQWRSTFTGTYYDSSDYDFTMGEILLSVDYFLIQDSSVKPFIGVNAGYGYVDHTITDNITGLKYSFDENGFLYGGQVGILFEVTEDVNIDLQARASYSSMDSLDYKAGIYAGIQYNF